jgi:hypothetical protein
MQVLLLFEVENKENLKRKKISIYDMLTIFILINHMKDKIIAFYVWWLFSAKFVQYLHHYNYLHYLQHFSRDVPELFYSSKFIYAIYLIISFIFLDFAS